MATEWRGFRSSHVLFFETDARAWRIVRSMIASSTEMDHMDAARIARVFDANLPRLSKPVRINSFHDAQVFVRRWAIRDKDLAIRALRRRLDRAHSAESADNALLELQRALASRGLLPPAEPPPP
jgi:hypothetical protein